MKRIVILGSTGSIGTQTLDVLSAYPERFEVLALSAGNNMTRLLAQIVRFRPAMVCVSSPEKKQELDELLTEAELSARPAIVCGSQGLVDLVDMPEADVIVVGLVGFVGLEPTLEALKSGKLVLTANKETFVTAGHLVSPFLHQIVPLDSEHSAIFQCLQGTLDPQREVRHLCLTASGGPFRETPMAALERVTVAEALNHPNWAMGQKISVDSATMMNKGLEVIEAHHLFQLPLDRIEVVVHPQSIVHSAVAFSDGSMLAQLGQPDMRVPILYGLSYPERWDAPETSMHLDLCSVGTLDFSAPDPERFPCLRLARYAAEIGGTMPVVLNAADELAVDAFLNGAIAFMEIPRVIERLMHRHEGLWQDDPDFTTICRTDRWTRDMFAEMMQPEPLPVV